MDMTKRIAACAALGLALGLTACSSSSGGGGGGDSDALSIAGDWSGEFADTHQVDPLFAHSPSGSIAITFEETDGDVTGDISMLPDPCDDSTSEHASKPETTGTITGTLSGSDIEFTYDTPIVTADEPDNSVTIITFAAEYIDSAQEFRGTYDATACSADEPLWEGQFVLSQD